MLGQQMSMHHRPAGKLSVIPAGSSSRQGAATFLDLGLAATHDQQEAQQASGRSTKEDWKIGLVKAAHHGSDQGVLARTTAFASHAPAFVFISCHFQYVRQLLDLAHVKQPLWYLCLRESSRVKQLFLELADGTSTAHAIDLCDIYHDGFAETFTDRTTAFVSNCAGRDYPAAL